MFYIKQCSHKLGFVFFAHTSIVDRRAFSKMSNNLQKINKKHFHPFPTTYTSNMESKVEIVMIHGWIDSIKNLTRNAVIHNFRFNHRFVYLFSNI